MRTLIGAGFLGAAAFLAIAAFASLVGAGVWWWPLLAAALAGGSIRAAGGRGFRAGLVAVAATYLVLCAASVPSVVRALYANAPGGPPLNLVSTILSWIATGVVVILTAIVAPVARAIENPAHGLLLATGLLVAASIGRSREGASADPSSFA